MSNKGKRFLFHNDSEYSELLNENGVYNGEDGTEIEFDADGSGHYHGSDGSEGYLFSDGSGYFEDADGSRGYKYSDGSGYFEDEYGEIEYWDAKENDEDIDIENDLAFKAGIALGKGFVGFLNGALKAYYENNVKDKNNYIDEDDEYEDDENEEDNENTEKYQYIINNENNNTKKDMLNGIISIVTILVLIGGILIFTLCDSTPQKGETKISINAKDYIGVQYEEVEEKMRSMGFYNIKCIEMNDLILGWFNKEGETERITINNNKDFKKDEIYPKNSDIVIYYHSFKHKK